MNRSKKLPDALQQILVQPRQALLTHTTNTIDPELLLQVGAYFCLLSAASPSLTAYQRRHLLLVLLTIRHVVPCWQQTALTTSHPQQPLEALATLVARTTSLAAAMQIIEDVYSWYYSMQINADHGGQELLVASIYTATKAVEGCITGTRIADYTAETHAGVALVLAADAFGAYVPSRRDERQRPFWLYWLDDIVPRAWDVIR